MLFNIFMFYDIFMFFLGISASASATTIDEQTICVEKQLDCFKRCKMSINLENECDYICNFRCISEEKECFKTICQGQGRGSGRCIKVRCSE